MPLIPDPNAQGYQDSVDLEQQYLDTARQNSFAAQSQARLLSQQRTVAPGLPGDAYQSLATAGASPNGPELTAVSYQYVPRSDTPSLQSSFFDRLGSIVEQASTLRVARDGTVTSTYSSMTPAQQAQVDANLKAAFAADHTADHHGGGWSWNPIHDLQHAGHDLADGASSAWDWGKTEVLRPITRWGNAAVMYPWEVMQNLAPTGHVAGGPVDYLSRAFGSGTTLGEDIAHGSGSGWLATTPQNQRRLNASQIALRGMNSAGTPNSVETAGPEAVNLVSRQVLHHDLIKPGSIAYNVIAGLTGIVAARHVDPAALGFEAWKGVTEAHEFAIPSEVEAEARNGGAVRGAFRAAVSPTDVEPWLQKGNVQRAVAQLAEEKNAGTILRRSWSGNGEGFPVMLAARIAEADTPEQVTSILRDAAGTEMKYVPSVSHFGGLGGSPYALRQMIGDPRWLADMPDYGMVLSNPEQAAKNIYLLGQEAKLPQEVIDARLNEFVRLAGNPDVAALGPGAYKSVLSGLGGDIERNLAGQNWFSGDEAASTARGIFDARESPDFEQQVRDTLTHTFPHATISEANVRDVMGIAATESDPQIASERILDYLSGRRPGMAGVQELEAAPGAAALGKSYVSAAVARKLSTYYTTADTNLGERWYDASAPGKVGHIAISGEMHPVEQPFSVNEHLQNYVPLPDARALKQATTMFPNLLGWSPKLGVHMMNPFLKPEGEERLWLRVAEGTNSLWKRTVVLTRPAVILRMLGAEQLAAALDGTPTALSHPFQLVANYLADKPEESLIGKVAGEHWSNVLDDPHNVVSRALSRASATPSQADMFGAAFADGLNDRSSAFSRASSLRNDPLNDHPDRQFIKAYGRISRTSRDPRVYDNAWGRELARTATEPVDAEVAGALRTGVTTVEVDAASARVAAIQEVRGLGPTASEFIDSAPEGASISSLRASAETRLAAANQSVLDALADNAPDLEARTNVRRQMESVVGALRRADEGVPTIPPPPQGYTRLWRGDATNGPRFADAVPGRAYFSTYREKAEYFAKTSPERARAYFDPETGRVIEPEAGAPTLRYVDMPTDQLAQHAAAAVHGTDYPVDEYLIPDELAARAKEAPLARLSPADARAAALDAVKQRFWDGDLSDWRTSLHLGADGSEHDFRPQLANRAGADDYIDAVANRVSSLTAEDPHLLNLVADRTLATMNRSRIDDALAEHLANLRMDGIGPEWVRGRLSTMSRGGRDAVKASYDQGMSWLFQHTIGIPSQKLMRSPAFADAYWAEVKRLAPGLDEEARQTVADALLRGDTTRLPSPVTESGGVTAAEADLMAKNAALDKVNTLFYDAHSRNNLTDALRIISPFAEVWRQELRRWTTLGVENAPLIVRRLGQLNGTLRSSHLIAPDPRTGKESLHVPIPGWAQEAAGVVATGESGVGAAFGKPFVNSIGAPTLSNAALNLNPASVSLIGQGLPGVGAVASLPLDALLRVTPSGDSIRKTLMPYGATDLSKGVGDAALATFTPTWLKSMENATAGANAQRNASTMADVMSNLQSANPDNYPNTPGGRQKLLNDAVKVSHNLWVVKGIAQSTSPATVSTEVDTNTKRGWTELESLADDWRNTLTQTYARGGTSADATREFLDRWGPSAGLAMTNQTQSRIYGLTATSDMPAWRAAHPDLVADYPDVWPLLVPRKGGSDPNSVDYLAIQRQIGDGERVSLTPRQRLELADYRLGQFVYDRYRSMLPANPNKAQALWLQRVHAAVGSRFPGWAQNNGQWPADIAQKADRDAIIKSELMPMLNDPRLADSPAAQAIVTYLGYRQEAIDRLGAQGDAKPSAALQSKRGAPFRAWLSAVAERVLAQYPQFGPVWDSLFQGEVASDAAPSAGPAVSAPAANPPAAAADTTGPLV